jgi:Flp pilus assembly protein TadD
MGKKNLSRGGGIALLADWWKPKPVMQGDSPSVQELFATARREHQAWRLDVAERLYRRVLAVAPRHADSLNLLGLVAHQTGRGDTAANLIRRAITINPTAAQYHCNLGVVLAEQGLRDQAEACHRKALALRPDYPEAHNNLGNVLWNLGHLDAAEACYRSALDLRPDYPEAQNNMANALQNKGHFEAAAACSRRAVELWQSNPAALTNLGNTLRDLGQLDEAVASHQRAIELRPDFADAHFNLAVALLSAGDMAAGWEEYEWRWQTPQMAKGRRDFAQPQWHGEAAAGQTLLIHAEQGFGDTLQFCRYATLAAERGLRVVMEVPKPLVRLLRGLRGIDLAVGPGESLPDFDLHCPMLSLPRAMGTTLASIPGAVPYLHDDPGEAAKWRVRLAASCHPGLKVGLVWAGDPRRALPHAAAVDRRRSIAPDRLAPLFAVSGVNFLSLQRAGPKMPARFPLIDFMDEMADFADTAALIANLDLVISVDTAVAHLAAALGRRVWLLDRFDSCWRWLTGRRDSPWYPTLRLHRQQRPGEWEPVVAEVAHDLVRLAAGNKLAGGHK